MGAAAAVLLLLFSLQQVLGENGYLTLRARQSEARQVEEDIRRLNEENQRLERQIKRLRSDPSAIERVAREEMKLARPREYIFMLPSEPPASPSTTATK